MDTALPVLTQVTTILDQLGIRYVLVGSFASSFHGMYRATADIDILADIASEDAGRFSEAFSESFYIETTVREALARRRSFKAIHYDSVFKVDFFVAKSDEFSQTQLARRQYRQIPNHDAQVAIASAEDTILAKLVWYRSGNETSKTQWNDVVGIFGANRNHLDLSYLRTWAEKLDLKTFLEKALFEADYPQ